MQINIDLHSHSGASGGVGKISLEQVSATMELKGIDVFGTGDAFHDGWLHHLEEALEESNNGLYKLSGQKSSKLFLIQTEIIITASVPSGGRKSVHTVLLFPSIKTAREVSRLFDRWQVKRNIGRPFLICEDSTQVSERLTEILKINQGIEIIPAHVLTPQGIFGSAHPVDNMRDFFGEAENSIKIVETGLSADPRILALIPELDHRTLLSSSDCHCGALNRVGREYTIISITSLSYHEIISALRNRNIICSAEFTPSEGRYFLTGHRAGKKGHAEGSCCYFSPDTVPENNICPICGKKLTVGVLQRALELSVIQGGSRKLEEVTPKQTFFHLIPLIEVIAAGLGIKNCASKKVTELYYAIIQKTESEAAFWKLSIAEVGKAFTDLKQPAISKAVANIKRGKFTFLPLGYDGSYGELKFGEKDQWFGHASVQNNQENANYQQKSLF